MFLVSGLSKKATSRPSVPHTITFPFESREHILSTLFRLILWFFYSLSLWSIRSLSSPLCFFSYFLTKRVCVCLHTAMYIDCWSHTFPQSVWVILFIPLSTPMSVKIVAIFWLSNNTIKIQKLVFPPLRAGSHWDGFGTARYANEASFMGAANDGSPKKSVQIIGVDARKRSTLFLSFHRKGIVRAAKTWLRYV